MSTAGTSALTARIRDWLRGFGGEFRGLLDIVIACGFAFKEIFRGSRFDGGQADVGESDADRDEIIFRVQLHLRGDGGRGVIANLALEFEIRAARPRLGSGDAYFGEDLIAGEGGLVQVEIKL